MFDNIKNFFSEKEIITTHNYISYELMFPSKILLLKL